MANSRGFDMQQGPSAKDLGHPSPACSMPKRRKVIVNLCAKEAAFWHHKDTECLCACGSAAQLTSTCGVTKQAMSASDHEFERGKFAEVTISIGLDLALPNPPPADLGNLGLLVDRHALGSLSLR